MITRHMYMCVVSGTSPALCKCAAHVPCCRAHAALWGWLDSCRLLAVRMLLMWAPGASHGGWSGHRPPWLAGPGRLRLDTYYM